MSGMSRDELNRKACALFARGEFAAVGCSAMRADTIGGEYYCDNLL